MKLALIMDAREPGDNRASLSVLAILGAERSDDRAHEEEHGEPMPGVDDGHEGLRAVKLLIDDRRGQHEAGPHEKRG